MTAFRAGLLAGLTLFVAGSSLLYLAGRKAVPQPPYNVEISTSGRDLTSNGAKALAIQTTYGTVLRQTCIGACDDLTYKADSSDNVFAVSVFDSAGGCLVCDEGRYVTHGVGTVDRVVVRGERKLAAEHHNLSQQPDGGWGEDKAPVPEVKP